MSDLHSHSPSPTVDVPTASSPLSVFLSFVLLLFLGGGVVAVLDHVLFVAFDREDLSAANELLFLASILVGFLTYGLMALIPGIPKWIFLPVSLFTLVAFVLPLPLHFYIEDDKYLIEFITGFLQVGMAVFLIYKVRRGRISGWLLFPSHQLGKLKFSWKNLAGVVALGAFLILPALGVYLAFTASLAVNHYSDGFIALRPSGVSMQVRKYVREDGKDILLVPMVHVGDREYYQNLAASFPEDSVILTEGVTDKQKLVKRALSYSKMATVIGGVQQSEAFKPRGTIVSADVDLASFSEETLELLKDMMMVHSKGITAETLPILLKPMPEGLEEQLFEDLITRRNQHLLGVLGEQLTRSNRIVIPWGAGHMPELAEEIQNLGFRLVDSRDFLAIRFGL